MPNWPWLPWSSPGKQQTDKEMDQEPQQRGRPRGSGIGQQTVEDILREGGKMSTREIAQEYHNRRDGPHIPFDGRARAAAESVVGQILRSFLRDEKVVNERTGHDRFDRRVSFWTLQDPVSGVEFTDEGPVGKPKPKGWTGGHAGAGEGDPAKRRTSRGTRYDQPKPIEPLNPVSLEEQTRRGVAKRARRTGDPATWGEADHDLNAGRDDMAPESDRNRRIRESRANPENWRPDASGGRGKPKRTADPATWGEQDKPSSSGQRGGVPGITSSSTGGDDDDDNDGDDGGIPGITKPSF
jgi:hypothetical protein